MNKGIFVRINNYEKQNLEAMKTELNNSGMINTHVFYSDFINIALHNTYKDCIKRKFTDNNMLSEDIEIDLKKLIEIFRKNNTF